MPQGIEHDFYISRKWLLMMVFRVSAWFARKDLRVRFGKNETEEVIKDAQLEFETLIPQLPYIGGWKNTLTPILISSGFFLAYYRVLKKRGCPVEEIGALVSEAVERFYNVMPRAALRLYSRRDLSEHGRQKIQQQALESQAQRFVGDWVYSFVPGNGIHFDYGLDFVECAICKFYRAQNATEFVPYLCALDFHVQNQLGWQLTRTKTIANGDDCCDFRFKRLSEENRRRLSAS